MKSEKIGIKWKIFIYMLAFTAVLLVILWLFQIAYLDSFYKRIKTREAESVLKQVTELVADGTDTGEASDAIDEIAAANNLSILVTDSDGSEVYHAKYIMNSSMEAMPADVFEQYYEQAKENGGTAKIEFEGSKNMTFNDPGTAPENGHIAPPEADTEVSSTPQKEDRFWQNHGQKMAESVIYVTISGSGDNEYVIMVNSVLTPVDATVNTLKKQLMYISLIMVVLSLLIALLLSKKISSSMIRVNDSAKKLAKGDYSVEFAGRDYREITELSNTLNTMTKELEKTESLRRELIANVSHDLRTPLTMIIAYAEVMRDLPGENTPENIQVVIDESKRLTNLVNDMLDISKLQAGALKREDKIFNLTESIKRVLERYNKLKEQEGYNICFVYEEEVAVCADEFKIYQVIYNLINNAINYAGTDKTVIVRQIIAGEKVTIEVTDHGDGIAPEELAYVWDRYYKVDKTHKRAVTGTGLGLSIVKNILELHDAQYGVSSEVGKGSTFWFTLDIAGGDE